MSQYDAEWDFIYADFEPAELDRGDRDDEWTHERNTSERNRDDTPDHEPIRRKVPYHRFGHPPGVSVGDIFTYRKDLHKAGVHTGVRSGIHGQKERGAFSIVMSGGYEDDGDKGDIILYVGAGGREKSNKTGPQVYDQSFEHPMNKPLLRSVETGNPVRVIRGHDAHSKYAPQEGYRYDGLYTVVQAEMKPGRSGFEVCVFELHRVPGQPPIPLRGDTSSGATAQARPRRTSTTHPKKRQRPREEHPNAPSSSTDSASRRLRADYEPSKTKHKSRDANATSAEASSSSTAAPPRPLKRPASPYDADSPARESPKKAARRSASDEGYKSEFDHSIDELVSTVKTSGFRTSSPGPSSRAASTSKAWTTAHPTLPSVRSAPKSFVANPANTAAPSTSAAPSPTSVKPRSEGHPTIVGFHSLDRTPDPPPSPKAPVRPAVSNSNPVDTPSSAPKEKPSTERRFVFWSPPRVPSSPATPSASGTSLPVPIPRRPGANGGSQAGLSTAVAEEKAASGSVSVVGASPPNSAASSAQGARRSGSGTPDEPIDLDEYEYVPRAGSQECPIVVDEETPDGSAMGSSTCAASVKREADAMDVDTGAGATAAI